MRKNRKTMKRNRSDIELIKMPQNQNIGLSTENVYLKFFETVQE